MAEIKGKVFDVPNNLDEALKWLLTYVPDVVKEVEIMEEDNTVMYHHNLGRFLRNTWRLWESTSPLVVWFKENHRINHPDDMTGIIFTSLYRKVKGFELNVEELVNKYLAHWAKERI